MVGETPSAAEEAARRTYEIRRKVREAAIEQPGHPIAPMPTFEEFVSREIVGTPDECIARLSQFEAEGTTYIRLSFDDPQQVEAFARLILPHYADARNGAAPRGDLVAAGR